VEKGWKTVSRNPFFNKSGYADPTAFYGTKELIKEEEQIDRKVHSLIAVMKLIAEWAGFEVIERIQLKHKETGKEFR
jgi:hypothetical protein